MKDTGRKNHWENVYQAKQPNEVSWYQSVPKTSLDFIQQAGLAKDAAIIDVGGGDSFFVDHLLNLGFTNVSVLDISESSLSRAKTRLGEKSSSVKWIVSDACDFRPVRKYDLWHDRAAFHFLTDEEQISKYVSNVENGLRKHGFLVLGTFSENGPKKCSGLEIKQYNENSMSGSFANSFDRVKCITENHTTPFNTVQNFLFCSFRKR